VAERNSQVKAEIRQNKVWFHLGESSKRDGPLFSRDDKPSTPPQPHLYKNKHHQTAKMAPPSQIAIATSSVTRLVKEEASYHKELVNQEARLDKLVKNEDGDENKEYQIKQEVCLSFLLGYECNEIPGYFNS
jgi:hypothetical protein